MNTQIFRVVLYLLIGCFLFCSCSADDPSKIVIAQIEDSFLYLDELLSEMDYWIYVNGTNSFSQQGENSNVDTQTELEELAQTQLSALISYYVALEKAEELNLANLSEKEKNEIYLSVEQDKNNSISYYEGLFKEKHPSLSEEELDILVENELDNAGYSESALTEYYTNSIIYQKIFAYYTETLTLSNAEVQEGYVELVEEAKKNYIDNPSRYDYDIFFGSTPYYTPAHVRRVKHILIALEESDATAVQEAYENGDHDSGDLLLADALTKIKGEADEVYARIMLDTSQFDHIMYELTDDIEVLENPDGYYVYQESLFYHPSFMDCVFSLESEGDISRLVATTSGYHIIKLEEIIPEGATPLEKVYNSVYDTLLQQKKETYFSELTQRWQNEYTIKIYSSRYLSYLEDNYTALLT